MKPHKCFCGARWGGYGTAHCCRCHHTFSGITAFDKHLNNKACQSPAAVGLVVGQHGYWGSPSEGEHWSKKVTP
jgi:hypothetical protein